MTEAALQIATADYCRYALTKDVIYVHIPNEGKRSPMAGARLKRQGMLPGVPDWLFLWVDKSGQTQTAFIELKTVKGKLQDTQKLFADRLQKVGVRWALCRSLEEFINTLQVWQIPTRLAKQAA